MKKLLFILCWLPFCAIAWAQSQVAPKHIDADFRQVRSSAMLQTDQVLTGRFVFDAPDRIQWKYNGGVEARLPEQMLRFISRAVGGGFLQSDEDFEVSRQGDMLTLTPKKKQLKKMFSSIVIRFSAQTGIAEEVLMTETGGDSTTIYFTNIHYSR